MNNIIEIEGICYVLATEHIALLDVNEKLLSIITELEQEITELKKAKI